MKVLIVDDDPVSRLAIVDLVDSFGMFDVVEAEDGDAAWELLDKGLNPVLCCCDIRMPKLSGIELLQKLRSTPWHKDLSFLLISSASDRSTVEEAIRLGATGYLLKPFEPNGALEYLKKSIAKARDKVAEDIDNTKKRLNLTGARLKTYIEAFEKQLRAAISEMPEFVEKQQWDLVVDRLDSLYTGCMTLGLWQGALIIDRARKEEFHRTRSTQALQEVLSLAVSQNSRIRG